MGKLTTHVLDTARGRPCAGMAIALYRLSPERILLAKTLTNADGRCDRPLLEGADFKPGTYELLFQAGDYFRAQGVRLPDPPFLDEIPIRFGIAEGDRSYHVPLLIAPFAYSTYRGS